MIKLPTIIAGLFALVVLAGCDNARPSGATTHQKVSDGKTKTDVTVEPGKPGVEAETKARKEAEKTKIKAKLEGIDANIKVLQDHAAKETSDAKKKIDDEIKALQSKREDLQKKYDNIDTTEASAWDNFVTELNKTTDSVSESSRNAADRIKK